MKNSILLSLLLVVLPTWISNFTKDKMIVFGSLSNYGCDFDGDTLGDLSVWDSKTNTLYFQLTNDNKFYTKRFINGDVSYEPVFADYDGDKKTDFVFYQPDTAQWILNLSTAPDTPVKTFLGAIQDLPVPVDLNNRKKYQPAIWRPGTGAWLLPSTEEETTSRHLHFQGNAGDIVFAADYDGDGKSDLGIWRSEGGFWYIDKSTTNYDPSQGVAIQHGQEWDIIVPNDYNGDGKCDLAFFRPQNQTWYFHYSGNKEQNQIKFGEKNIIPLSLDLDGDKIPELITWDSSKKSWNTLNFIKQESNSYKWNVPAGCIPASSILQKYE